MTTEIVKLDITQEPSSSNGHEWHTFDDDQAFLRHITSKKPAEELVEVPEWEVKVLCRALDLSDRLVIEKACYDEQAKSTDYRKDFYKIAMLGCFNPTTNRRIFTESNRAVLVRNAAPIIRLAVTVLRLSGLLPSTQERTRKN